MLRQVTACVLIVAIAAIVAFWWFAGGPLLVPALCWAVLLLAALALERWRYKATDAHAPAGFERTSERFIDPVSQQSLAVYFNPRTGERQYVDDSAS